MPTFVNVALVVLNTFEVVNCVEYEPLLYQPLNVHPAFVGVANSADVYADSYSFDIDVTSSNVTLLIYSSPAPPRSPYIYSYGLDVFK